MVTGPPLRIVFFGTPDFAVPTLETLLHSRHAVVGVVTRADRARGRGQKTTMPPVKARAIAAGVRVLQPERIADPAFVRALTDLGADLGVVAAYGKILTESVLGAPRLGLVNVHASLLPRHRGAAPVHRAVIAGDEQTGVTIMRMVKALDAGPMLATARRTIGPNETSAEVERDLSHLGAPLLLSIVEALSNGPVHEVPQGDDGATYAHRITREDGRIDWSRPAAAIHNLIRGLHPWPHAFTYHRGHRLILLASSHESATGTGEAPGTLLAAGAVALRVATGDGVLVITSLQAEGRRPMTTREFLAGHQLAAGDLLALQP